MLYTAGQELLDRKQLHAIPVPERNNVSAQWQGVNHGDLADAIVNGVTKVGFNVSREQWYCNPNQTALFGAVDIPYKGTMFEEELASIGMDATFSLGVRHDNMGRYAVTFAVGARIAVCSNGVFSGDFVLKNRHYGSLDLNEAVREGVDNYINEMSSVADFINGMQHIPLDDKDASYLILQAAESIQGNSHGCLNWAHLKEVYQKWKQPPHEEFAPRTQWSLYNAFTETAKKVSPPRQMGLLKGLRPIMTDFANDYLTISLSSMQATALRN